MGKVLWALDNSNLSATPSVNRALKRIPSVLVLSGLYHSQRSGCGVRAPVEVERWHPVPLARKCTGDKCVGSVSYSRSDRDGQSAPWIGVRTSLVLRHSNRLG